ncbi:MAG TPA: GspH/FimT family protein [Candidatus Tectomicrobia bacterium]|nr:GspH/FimT family protein [Candidatus Tectomicrobia bacterium]
MTHAVRGFTLAELIVVVAIIAIIAAIGIPTMWTYFRTAALRGGAEELVTALNGARQLAIRSNQPVCVTNDGTRLQYHVGACGNPAWTGPGTDAAGNVALTNGITVAGPQNLCFSYLGAGTTTPAGCIANGTFTVTNPANGGTMNVIVATTGRVRIQ